MLALIAQVSRTVLGLTPTVAVLIAAAIFVVVVLAFVAMIWPRPIEDDKKGSRP